MTTPREEQPQERAPATPTVSTGPPRSRWRFGNVPDHLGRARTSTLVLSALFVAIFVLWVYVRPPTPTTAATTGIVPAPTAPATTPAPTTSTTPTETTTTETTTTTTPTETTTGESTTPETTTPSGTTRGSTTGRSSTTPGETSPTATRAPTTATVPTS